MYRHLQSIAALVAVVETGGFGKAAKRLGLTPSVISHHIAKLEDHLGETLIYRTTRKLSLSPSGRQLFEAANSGLASIQEAVDAIQDHREQAVGSLRIALPAFVSDPAIEARIMAFAANHPNVALSLNYSDNIVDMVAEEYDLSIRIGRLHETSFMQKKLSDIQHILVATPDFLKHHDDISHPQALSNLPYVAMQTAPAEITLIQEDEQCLVPLNVSQIQMQSILAARTATLAGLGIGNLPEPLVREDLASGQLVHVLPNWALPPLAMHALWPQSTKRMNLTNRLVDFLTSSEHT
jgi:DNA-binding transcriptional LysR family regulator